MRVVRGLTLGGNHSPISQEYRRIVAEFIQEQARMIVQLETELEDAYRL